MSGWACCRHCGHAEPRHRDAIADLLAGRVADAATPLPAAVPLSAPDRRDGSPPGASRPTRREPGTDALTTSRNLPRSRSDGAAEAPGGGEDDAFGIAFRHAIIAAHNEGYRHGYRVGYDAALMDIDHAGIGEA